jgi:hypothetical protein
MVIGLHGVVTTKTGLPLPSQLLSSVPPKVLEYFNDTTEVKGRAVKQWTHFYLMANHYYAFEQPVASAVGGICAILSCDALNLDLANLFSRMREVDPESETFEICEAEPEPPTQGP